MTEGHIDNSAAFLAHHRPKYRARAVHCARKVGMEDSVPVLIFHAHQQSIPGNARIIYQDIYARKLFQRQIHQRFDIAFLRHVRLHIFRVETLFCQRLGDRGNRRFGPRAQHDTRPFFTKLLGDCRAYAARSTCNYCDFILKLHSDQLDLMTSTVFSRLFTSSTFRQIASSRMRRTIPHKTFPGPSSTTCDTPESPIVRNDFSH